MRASSVLPSHQNSTPSLLKASPKGEGVHPSQSGTLSSTSPPDCSAQTSVTLVSNQGQLADDSASTSGNDQAQLFHTGAHAAGYTFTGMYVSSEDAEGDDFDVEICEEDGSADEFPSSTCTALTAPGSFAAGLVLFTHTGLALSANTGDQAARHRERGAQLHPLRRRRYDRPLGVEHQRHVLLEQQRHLDG